MPIALGPCRTRSGAPARVLCNDIRDPQYPVVAVVEISPTEERYFVYSADGRFDSSAGPSGKTHDYDLVQEASA